MGPLAGIKVIELAGIGPAPFCATLLADMGAEVLRIDRTEDSGLGIAAARKYSILNRSRRSLAIDLKKAEGVETVLRLIEQSDALIEGFRPGVMERLGLGPDVCMARNPKLVYGRMTGFGQEGPVAHAAGHDLNYIALSGMLHAIGREGQAPTPPLNLVGDFGGGGMFLAVGLLAALLEAGRSGQGQVVDAAMVEGAAYLGAALYGMFGSGFVNDERGTNILDSGAHFYECYETKDGKYVSIASIEPKFYAELLQLTGLEGEELPEQMAREEWPAMKKRFAQVFKAKTRDEWCEIMEGSDVCFAPVLSMSEVQEHGHNQTRNSFIDIDGVTQPAPAPRFSRTKAEVQCPPGGRGQHTKEVLAEWGLGADEIAGLESAGAIYQS
ncbi:MAG: CaiB/BaiF CoA-transferase family protein [Alphaproteobacteria bacterium]|nr:CaiB/BaiF CoA-transferase family protein [Alphaproteobacteria bacterium]